MKIELNIGLTIENGGLKNWPDQRQERCQTAIRHLLDLCSTAYIDRRTVSHDGPDGETATIEDTIVAELDTNAMSALDIVQLKGRLHNLCITLEQECIAMYLPAQDVGELVGPKAAKWGEFDIRHFARRHPVAEQRKAA